MCLPKSPSIPKPQPPEEPLKQVDAEMASASASAARSQAMRRGLASTWTRYNSPAAAPAGTADTTTKASKLGG